MIDKQLLSERQKLIVAQYNQLSLSKGNKEKELEAINTELARLDGGNTLVQSFLDKLAADEAAAQAKEDPATTIKVDVRTPDDEPKTDESDKDADLDK